MIKSKDYSIQLLCLSYHRDGWRGLRSCNNLYSRRFFFNYNLSLYRSLLHNDDFCGSSWSGRLNICDLSSGNRPFNINCLLLFYH